MSKTRLIPALGAQGAAALAAAFIMDLTERLAGASLGRDVRRVLCYDNPDAGGNVAARDAFKALLAAPGADGKSSELILKRFSLLAQSGGDLGERLGSAMKTVRLSFEGPLLLIGSDAPDLPEDELLRGLELARAGKAYLKPAEDGGYVLLALPAAARHTVFDEVEWSTAETARTQAARLRAMELPTIVSNSKWPDVDRPADLPLLLKRLEANPGIARRTLAVLRG